MQRIITFMRQLDGQENHGYIAASGLGLRKPGALATHKGK
jgi:hypothetical protein